MPSFPMRSHESLANGAWKRRFTESFPNYRLAHWHHEPREALFDASASWTVAVLCRFSSWRPDRKRQGTGAVQNLAEFSPPSSRIEAQVVVHA